MLDKISFHKHFNTSTVSPVEVVNRTLNTRYRFRQSFFCSLALSRINVNPRFKFAAIFYFEALEQNANKQKVRKYTCV